MRRRLSSIHSDHKRIAIGAMWVAAFVLLGKLVGAAKEMAIAYRYGVSGVVDSYQLALTINTWLPTTLVAVMTTVMIPLMVQVARKDPAGRLEFLRELNGAAIALGLVFAAGGIAFAQYAIGRIAGSLSDSTQKMAVQFTLELAPTALLTLLIGVYSIRLMAQERQLNTLLEGLPAFAILLCVMTWPNGEATPLILGTSFGFAIQTIWLAYIARDKQYKEGRPRLSFRSQHWRAIYSAMAIMAGGQFLMSFITPLDQYYAAILGDSAIATLGYANRVIALLVGIGAMAIARSALPVMANLQAASETVRAHQIAMKWAWLMLMVGLIVSIVSIFAAPYAVALLFERGAFTASDTENVVRAFRYGLIQIPFYFSGLVLVQLLASRRRYDVIAFFAASNLVIKWLLNILLPPVYGVPGITMATGLMYAWSAGCLYFGVMHTKPKH